MLYNIEISNDALEQLGRHKKAGNKKLLLKIKTLLEDIEHSPRTGLGKPERLKGYHAQECYSRRIDAKHRMVYQILEDTQVIIILSVFGHYEE